MNAITHPLNSAERLGRLSRANAIAEAVRGVLDEIAAWNNRRATRNELLALDDRMLLDIGLSRADVVGYHADPRGHRTDGVDAADA
jgi:uncharacterized protein YjiS (DUF1127 family)